MQKIQLKWPKTNLNQPEFKNETRLQTTKNKKKVKLLINKLEY